jgi:hypothetical protein
MPALLQPSLLKMIASHGPRTFLLGRFAEPEKCRTLFLGKTPNLPPHNASRRPKWSFLCRRSQPSNEGRRPSAVRSKKPEITCASASHPGVPNSSKANTHLFTMSIDPDTGHQKRHRNASKLMLFDMDIVFVATRVGRHQPRSQEVEPPALTAAA